MPELCSDVDRAPSLSEGKLHSYRNIAGDGFWAGKCPPNFASFPGAQDVTLLGNRVVRILLVTMRSDWCRVGP